MIGSVRSMTVSRSITDVVTRVRLLALRRGRADRAPHLLRAIRLILAPSVTLVPTPPEQSRATRPTFAVTGHQLAIGDEVPGELVGRLDVDARDPAGARIE